MKALFLGLGGVGQRHLRNLRTLHPDAEVFAVRHSGRSFEIGNDMKADNSVDVVAKYGVEVIADVSAIEPDFAVVANPSGLHVEAALPLVERGIPVFLEKPAASLLADFDRLAAAADTRGVPVTVAYQMRWHPCVLKAKEWLDGGRIGRVQSAEVSVHAHMPSWHAYEKPTEFYAGSKALGGGVVLTEIHEIDLLAWFFGKPAAVMAVGGTIGDYGLEVEDTVAAAIECTHRGRAFPLSLLLSFVQNPPARRFLINGTEGKILLELPKLQAVLLDGTGAETDRIHIPDFDRNRMFVNELAAFLEAVGTGTAAPSSLADVRDGQATAEAILRSLESKTSEAP